MLNQDTSETALGSILAQARVLFTLYAILAASRPPRYSLIEIWQAWEKTIGSRHPDTLDMIEALARLYVKQSETPGGADGAR